MNRWVRNRKTWRVLLGAAVILCTGIIYTGVKETADRWKYQIQNLVFRRSGEMYMPLFLYAESKNKSGAGEWLREKALDWLPVVRYVEDNPPYEGAAEDDDTMAKILESQSGVKDAADKKESPAGGSEGSGKKKEKSEAAAGISIEKLRDFDYLLSHFYIVDSSTMIGPEQLNADDLLGRSMKIDADADGPKVLIYHTHSQEEFIDSTPGDPSESIVGVGRYLTELLNEKGIETIHDTGVYDTIDGKLDRSNAYGQAETAVSAILEKNPTVEVVIDLHRDGVSADTRLVTEINGKQTAKIMFFNGLSRSRTNGDIEYLSNPYIQDNLAFSFQMKLACEENYPGFTRNIYLRAYRYNLHLMPKSLLIEAGAQTNTVEEMMNAMEILADVLCQVLTEK